MKTQIFFIAVFMITQVVTGQEPCKVLMETISSGYEGACRNGLAHGFGKATGVDTYEGNFRRGLPHGRGTYTWSHGDVYEGSWRRGEKHGAGKLTRIVNGEPEIKEGVWRNGEFDESRSGQPQYRVNRQRSIDYVRVIETGAEEQVRVRIWRGGSRLSYTGLRVHHSSGTYQIIGEEILFQHVTFPFTFSVFYNVPNKMRTGRVDCELEVTINNKGSWEITTNQ